MNQFPLPLFGLPYTQFPFGIPMSNPQPMLFPTAFHTQAYNQALLSYLSLQYKQASFYPTSSSEPPVFSEARKELAAVTPKVVEVSTEEPKVSRDVSLPTTPVVEEVISMFPFVSCRIQSTSNSSPESPSETPKSVRRSASAKKSASPKESSACPLCGKTFSRQWLLQGHIRTHTGEKPFECDVCKKSFADKSNLRAHRQTHSDYKQHECDRCGKRFTLKSYLSKHRESSCLKHNH